MAGDRRRSFCVIRADRQSERCSSSKNCWSKNAARGARRAASEEDRVGCDESRQRHAAPTSVGGWRAKQRRRRDSALAHCTRGGGGGGGGGEVSSTGPEGRETSSSPPPFLKERPAATSFSRDARAFQPVLRQEQREPSRWWCAPLLANASSQGCLRGWAECAATGTGEAVI